MAAPPGTRVSNDMAAMCAPTWHRRSSRITASMPSQPPAAYRPRPPFGASFRSRWQGLIYGVKTADRCHDGVLHEGMDGAEPGRPLAASICP